MTGGVVSTKVMVCEQEALLEQASVAVQVRWKTLTAGQVAGSVTSTKVTVTLVSQISLAVGVSKAGVAPATHSSVWLEAQVMTGGVVSTKVMVCEQEAVLVQASVAVQVRWKTLTAGQVAGSVASTKVTVTLVSQVSLAVAVPKLGAAPATHSSVWFEAQVMTGGLVSTKVMVCEQEAVLVQASVAVQVRWKILTAGQVAGSVTSTKVTVTLVSHMSVAVGVPKMGAAPVTHASVWLEAQVTTGGVVSTTVTVWLHRLVLPQSSTTRQLRVAVKPHEPETLVTVLTVTSEMLLPPQGVFPSSGGLKPHMLPHSADLFDEHVSKGMTFAMSMKQSGALPAPATLVSVSRPSAIVTLARPETQRLEVLTVPLTTTTPSTPTL